MPSCRSLFYFAFRFLKHATKYVSRLPCRFSLAKRQEKQNGYKDILCERRFDAEKNTWNTSEIWKWLDDEFIQSAFNKDEASSISVVGHDGVSDRIFLLSGDEAEDLLTEGERGNGIKNAISKLRSKYPEQFRKIVSKYELASDEFLLSLAPVKDTNGQPLAHTAKRKSDVTRYLNRRLDEFGSAYQDYVDSRYPI